jgi:hypothetical protein
MSAPNYGVNGTVCTADQYQKSTNLNLSEPHPTITCLTHGQSIGLTVTAEASFLSLIAVMFVFVLIGRNMLRYRKVLPNGSWKLLQRPSDIYMLSLLMYDILQAMGGILDIRWAHNGIVTIGPYCTAQGVIQQIGELGVALITLILTAHTFVVALWKVGIGARHFAFGIVALATLYVALWVSIGNGIHKHYETPTPYWCWVGPANKVERLAGEYVWLWIALFASVIMYIPLYFWTKGRLSIDPKKWYKFQLSESEDAYQMRQAALGMLFYPLAYSLMVLPISITRWLTFSHKHEDVPSAATFFSVSMFNLSGAINVLLFLVVRPQLLLFTPPEGFSEPESELADPSTSSAILEETAKYKHSPQPTGMELASDEGWNPPHDANDVALSPVDPMPRLEELEDI